MKEIGLGIGLHGKNNVNPIIAGLFRRSYVAGLDGSIACTRATQRVCPITGATLPVNTACQTTINLGGKRLPLFGAWGARTNLFLNSDAPATQDITVGTGSVTVFARTGTGYTVSVSAGTATGSGFGDCPIGTPKTVTITGAGTITVTITGTPVGGKVSVEQAGWPSPYIPTAGTAVQHNADAVVWTPPVALSASEGEVAAIVAPYRWSANAGAFHQNGVSGRIAFATNQALLLRGNADTAQRYDSAPAVRSAGMSALADVSGALRYLANKWDSVVRLYQGGVLTASGAATPTLPWTAPTAIRVGGDAATADREFCGFTGIIYTPGGMTDAERAAIQRYVVGRSLTYAL